MLKHSMYRVICAAASLAALLAPGLRAQTTPTCNGLPATIVATVPGQIMGTTGDDVIVGTGGDDRIFGLSGNDTICGLGGNDQITGGQGADHLFGDAGNDTFFWFPGDASDRVEGASETDTLQLAGGNVNEIFDLSTNGNRLRLFRNVGAVTLDVAGVERVGVSARGGSDMIVVNPVAGLGIQQLTLNLEGIENSNTPDGLADSIAIVGGTLNDTINISGTGNKLSVAGAGPVIEIRNSEGALDAMTVYGMDGHDQIGAAGLAAGLINLTLQGGFGSDTLTGSQGSDVLAGGDDNDTLVWTLGSPPDQIVGDAGVDTLQVLGSAAADNATLSAATVGIQVVPAVGAPLQADVEQVVLQAGWGADQVTVNSLAGSTLQKVTIDLKPTPTSPAGDGARDVVFVNGTIAADTIAVSGTAGNVTITGVAPMILVQGSEGALDTLNVYGGYEADILNAQSLAAGVVRLVLRGGMGGDTVTGTAGDDVFGWALGDGNDVIEGGLGNDTLQIAGSAVGEKIGLTANGARLRFTRDIGTVVLDANGVENVTHTSLGGSDTITLGDLSGTSVRRVSLDLAGPTSSNGDGQPDTIQISAVTAGSSIVTALGPGTITIFWRTLTVSVTGVEPANDRFVLQTAVGAAPAIISSL
jgi:Ca2+-binding RTX toxin-like protein